MPSASAKIEKVTSHEGSDPMKQFVNILEKKIRNLEKRKVKLDNYRNDVKNGKELNEDQKIAVSKYDLVQGLLEFSQELKKSLDAFIVEYARQLKKQAKKEQLERQQHEIQRLQQAFIFRHILSCLQNAEVRNDFVNGENGAVELPQEKLTYLDHFYKILEHELPSEQADLTNHFHILAENYIFLVEGKNKEIAGTTYKVLKENLQNIIESGYFSRSSETTEEAGFSDEIPEEAAVEHIDPDKEVIVSNCDVENSQVLCNEQNKGEINEVALSPVQTKMEPTSITTPSLQNGPLQEVLSPQGSFNFLQESQIDLDAPHMDPAVVAVHQMAPPPAVNFSVNPYPTSPSATELPKQVINGSESCDIARQSQQQQAVVNAGVPRTVAPVLTSVRHEPQHDFDPSHPIPTQTFTNQSFAVMQNMIMPQGYVPVTMHHAPIPPHIAPLAVVPGLSPPVTSAPTPVVPLHVPVVPPTSAAASEEISEENQLKGAKHDDIQNQTLEDNRSAQDAETPINDTSNDKNGNANDGYSSYRGGGYRGRGRGRGPGYFRSRSNYNNGRGGYQNHFYQERNGYNGNFKRGNYRASPRGNGNNNRGRGGNNFRAQSTSQQQGQQQQ